jgi:predicted secreted protein
LSERVHARLGDVFEIELEAIPGAGMIWEIDVDPKSKAIVSLVKNYWENNGFQSGGGKNIQHFVFSALAVGEAKIIFRLKRSWEKDVSHDEKVYLLVIDE